jgi:hypothetical protein
LQDHGYITIQHSFDKPNQYQFQWDRPQDKNVRWDRTKMSIPQDKNVQTIGQICPRPQDKNVRLTTEGTTERTNQRTTQEGVCDPDSSLGERKFPIKEYREFNSSLKASPCPSPSAQDATNLSDERESNLSEEDENLFASLMDWEPPLAYRQQQQFPSQQKDIALAAAPPVASVVCPVAGIPDPRGALKWIPESGKEPLKRWLTSKGLKRKYVDSLRWTEMVSCYNDDAILQAHCNEQYGLPNNKPPVNDPDERPLPNVDELRHLRSRKSEMEQIFDDALAKFEGW